jgi:hypothetical protein
VSPIKNQTKMEEKQNNSRPIFTKNQTKIRLVEEKTDHFCKFLSIVLPFIYPPFLVLSPFSQKLKNIKWNFFFNLKNLEIAWDTEG